MNFNPVLHSRSFILCIHNVIYRGIRTNIICWYLQISFRLNQFCRSPGIVWDVIHIHCNWHFKSTNILVFIFLFLESVYFTMIYKGFLICSWEVLGIDNLFLFLFFFLDLLFDFLLLLMPLLCVLGFELINFVKSLLREWDRLDGYCGLIFGQTSHAWSDIFGGILGFALLRFILIH